MTYELYHSIRLLICVEEETMSTGKWIAVIANYASHG